MGDPWLPAQSDGPGGRIAAVYPGSPVPPGSRDAGSHCAQTVPIASVNACQ